MSTLQILGRRSSLFTRMALIFATELQIPYELVPIYDMTALSDESYASHPALKLPVLRDGERVVFGTQNICRALAELAVVDTTHIVWPEQLRDDLSRNAQELVWHCMATQVQLIIGTAIGKLPADNIYFKKARLGMDGSLAWLDSNVSAALAQLPGTRTLSIFEVSLFCLIEHLQWRKTVTIDSYTELIAFARAYSTRPGAVATAYQFDVPQT